MRPIIFRATCLVASLLAVGIWVWHAPNRAHAGIPDVVLSNGARSPEELVARFVAALSANDRKAIESLRVDEHEYRTLIMPGSVKPGQPPQIMPDDKSEYFWRHNNTVSTYTLNGLLKTFGGKTYRVDRIEIHRVDPFAWYTAHRDPIIHLETDDGIPFDMQVGSIAEHNGRFKFISYYAD